MNNRYMYNQNNEVDFDTMTDDNKITRIKEYIKSELHHISDNDLEGATNQYILNKLETIYRNIEGELIEDGKDLNEWGATDETMEFDKYKAFIEAKLAEENPRAAQSQQGGRKTKRKSRKSKKSKRKSRKSRRKSRKSKRKSKRK